MKNIRVALDDRIDAELTAIAQEEQTTKEALIREAVRDFAARRRKDEVFREMRRYAETMAPHSGEFVAETGACVDERLLRETEW